MNHSYLNPKCESRNNERGGCSVFAKEFISKGEVISLWGGTILHKKNLDRAMPRFTERVIQVDEELYLLTAEEKEPNDCFNHSCEPNLGFSGQIGLVTLCDVEAGQELCFDYAMSDGEPYDEFDCLCGSLNCRKKITGDDWKNPLLWVKYKNYFSPYLAKRIENLTK